MPRGLLLSSSSVRIELHLEKHRPLSGNGKRRAFQELPCETSNVSFLVFVFCPLRVPVSCCFCWNIFGGGCFRGADQAPVGPIINMVFHVVVPHR